MTDHFSYLRYPGDKQAHRQTDRQTDSITLPPQLHWHRLLVIAATVIADNWYVFHNIFSFIRCSPQALMCMHVFYGLFWCLIDYWLYISRIYEATCMPHWNMDVRKPNFCSVSVFKNPNRTQAKRSNPKFRFPWLFSKPNLSHTNSQYLSYSRKALTFFTLRILSDSKWS